VQEESKLTESDVEFLIGLARQEAELIDRLQEALKRNDTLLALHLAREVCGLPEEQAQ
jgi:hypothetical protein